MTRSLWLAGALAQHVATSTSSSDGLDVFGAGLGGGVLLLVGLLALVALYFLPTLIAARRNPPHVLVIALLNVFLGWTLAGWVAALALSLAALPLTRPSTASTAR
jgi:hypothetical protein